MFAIDKNERLMIMDETLYRRRILGIKPSVVLREEIYFPSSLWTSLNTFDMDLFIVTTRNWLHFM